MENINLKEIGRRISERRRQLGYTQEQMAEWMNVSIQMISNLERGNKSMRIENLLKISSILNISTDYILTGETGLADTSELAKQLKTLSEKDFQMVRMLIEFCLSKD